MSIRICIVDDDPRIGEALELLFHSAKDFACDGFFQTAQEALAQVPRLKPDVVLMDINLGGASGIDCVRALKRKVPEIQVLMLTVYEDSEKIFQSLIAGASGYLLKRAPKEQLLRAVTDVHQGGAPFTSNIARKVVQYFQELPSAKELETLTPREREILDQLARGCLYKEIASHLGIALDTVRKHVRSVYEKMHVRSRSEAIAKYLKR
ncbi:MAG: response regulator transcription factor [Verrucomicrobiales bacterium]|nr:response regulator transcription factor [Verrucomicrobiales bacterium]